MDLIISLPLTFTAKISKKTGANHVSLIKADAFESYLKSGSGHAFAKRHFW